MFLLFLVFIFDKKEKFKERGAVVKAFKQRNQDTACITSIDDTVHGKICLWTHGSVCGNQPWKLHH